MQLMFMVFGLALLVVGAELLVRGASRLATAVGISPLVVGLTVVAFGTSSPEIAVSVQSALQGQADLVIGNVVGSNIFNILVIIGLAAVITPLVAAQQIVRLDVPILIGVTWLTWLLAGNGVLSRWEGALLFGGLIAYIAFLLRLSRRERADVTAEYDDAFGASAERPSQAKWLLNGALVIVGLGLLVLGSNWLVNGAVAVAQFLGLSELIIGLTILAAGTSLPEVATSVLAALRGERDIAVGNAVGSNLFNILGVLGIAGMMAPGGVSVTAAALNFDFAVLAAVSFAALPIFFTGNLVARWEGWVFLGYYVAYTAYLVLAATQHDALPWLSGMMWLFVMPLTVLTVAIGVVRELRKRQAVQTART